MRVITVISASLFPLLFFFFSSSFLLLFFFFSSSFLRLYIINKGRGTALLKVDIIDFVALIKSINPVNPYHLCARVS